jgi:hypothetical protein
MAKQILGWFLIIAAFGAPAALGAQTPSDSNCVRVTGSEAGLFLTLSRGPALTGALPVSFCDLERNASYRLTLDGEGFERRVGKFSIAGGSPRVSGIRAGLAGRNIVLPGWGTARAGRAPAAWTDDMSIAASLAWLLYENHEYNYMRDIYDDIEERYEGAQTWEEKAGLQSSLHEASRELNVQNDQCTRIAILAGALYAWQVIEPLFVDNPPKSTVGAGGEFALGGAHESRAKAFVYSMIRPGRGQYYQGKTARGAFFSLATFAVGLVALEYQTCYEYAVSDYEICVERFNATTDVAEQLRLKSDAERYWDHLELEEARRNSALIVLAGLWGWNVLDTFFPVEHRSPAGKYSFEIDARGASVAMRF